MKIDSKEIDKMGETFLKINDIYVSYLLNDKKKHLIQTKYSQATITKYINIMEKLDIRLFSYLDQTKDRKKLTMGNTEKLIQFCDPHLQYFIFKNEPKLTKSIIESYHFCQICCSEKSFNMMLTPCCNQFICENCLIDHFKYKMNDIKFNIMKCLFCNEIFTFYYISWLLKKRYRENVPWMKSNSYLKLIRYSKFELYNILKKYKATLFQIEREQNNNQLRITDLNLNDLPNLLGDKIFGPCSKCSPKILKYKNVPLHHWELLRIKGIPKECVNNEGENVVLNENMFLCDQCDDKINNINQEIKKCPHCNIKTIKPSNCNFVICQCKNFWCFLCGCRLYNDMDGHNRHYYIGPGSGPYGNSCRYTTNSFRPTFEIQDCFCDHCSIRGGLSLCLNIDCDNITPRGKHYCGDHQ